MIFRTKKWETLPNRLKTLLLDNSVVISGNKISADLKYIGDDFNVEEIISLDQKSRSNVVNLAMLAKERGVVTDARSVGLESLSEMLLKVKIDKSLQTSGFDGDELTPAELKYVAIDAAVSLECYEKLMDMPDIYRHLEVKDLELGKKVSSR